MQGKGWEIVESERSFEENIDIFKTVKKLFDLENPTHTRQTIFTGTDSEMMEKIELARAEMNRINSEGYDYNLPVFLHVRHCK